MVSDVHFILRLIDGLIQVRLCRLHRHLSLNDPALIAVEQGQRHAEIEQGHLLVVGPAGPLHGIAGTHRDVRVPIGLGEFQVGFALRKGRAFRSDVRPRLHRRGPQFGDVGVDPAVVQFRGQFQLGAGGDPQELSQVRARRFRFLDRRDDLGLEVHHLQTDPDEIDLRDVAFLESNGIDIKDPGEPVPIFFGQGKPALGQLDAEVSVFDRKAELADRILELGFRGLHAIARAFDPVAAFSGNLEQLLDLAGDAARRGNGIPLGERGDVPHLQHGIGQEPGGDLLPLARLDPILGDEQIQILFQKQTERFREAQSRDAVRRRRGCRCRCRRQRGLRSRTCATSLVDHGGQAKQREENHMGGSLPSHAGRVKGSHRLRGASLSNRRGQIWTLY